MKCAASLTRSRRISRARQRWFYPRWNRGLKPCAWPRWNAGWSATCAFRRSRVARSLLDAAKSADLKLAPRALEGLSYLASSRRATSETIDETLKLLKAALDAPEPEQLETRTQDSAGGTVFEISGGERYAVDLPIV